MATGSSLSITCTPNGFEPGTNRLLVSLSFLPSVDGVQLVNSAFANWPIYLKVIRASLKASTIQFKDSNIQASFPIHLLDEDDAMDVDSQHMWTALFGYLQHKPLQKRDAGAAAQTHASAWMLSHEASTLRYMHLMHRTDRMAAEAHALTGDRSKIARVNEQQRLINIHLHANLTPVANDREQTQRLSFGTLLKARENALGFCNALASGRWPTGTPQSATFSKLMTARFKHALNLLQRGEERLLDIGIYASFVSCVTSLQRHKDPVDPQVVTDAESALNFVLDRAMGLDGADPGDVARETTTAFALDQAVIFAEFLLFSRRSLMMTSGARQASRMPMEEPQKEPDFHQVLDLLRRFPPILRPLGLVFDVACDLPDPSVLPSGTYRIAIDGFSLGLASLDPSINLWTACSLVRPGKGTRSTFYAANIPLGISTGSIPGTSSYTVDRYLNLGAVAQSVDSDGSIADFPLYSIVTEDSENETHKRLQASKSESQSHEYDSKANKQAGSSKTAPLLDKLPSTRTGGISLLHAQRLERVKQTTSRVSDPRLGSFDMPFFADDLVMGYRYDVRLSDVNRAPGKWYSLGDRVSSYTFVDENGASIGRNWSPRTTWEKLADEGYVSAATTMTKPKPSDGEKQLQAHPAIFTWSGPGIGYTQSSKGEAINHDGTSKPPPPGSNYLRMTPKHSKGKKLLQLRYRHRYDLRCRLVDIAGNSASPEETAYDFAVGQTAGAATFLSVLMQRHEPLRSPDVLLTQRLDRLKEPGAQVNRLVVGPGRGETARALVPPREGLRFAFMHGVVKDKNTPGAFNNIELNDDGTFPSVDPQADSVESKDAIFRYSKNGGRNKRAPYFPDPLVDQVRLSLDSFSAPKGVRPDELQRAIADTFSFYPNGDVWPFCSPFRLRLIGAKDTVLKAERRSVLLDDNGPNTLNVDGLILTLPPATVINLRVSSAGTNVDAVGARSQTFPLKVAAAVQGGTGGILAIQQVDFPPEPCSIKAATKRYSAFTKNQGLRPAPAPGQPRPQLLQAADRKPLSLVDATRRWATSISLPDRVGLPRAFASPEQLGMALLSGHFECATPSHTVTLVHAVQKPLIEAAPQNEDFRFKRNLGETAAKLVSPPPGEKEVWVSAAKIACNAKWTDSVDDLSKDGPGEKHFGELVFELSEAEWSDTAKLKLFHHLRDTRAHEIEYQLSASSRFRDYFPTDADPNSFNLKSEPLKKITVCSSVRPPAPVLSYFVPSFAWRENVESTGRGWVRTRVPALRCYHERPFRISGDKEKLAIVLLRKGDTDVLHQGASDYVSRIGQDPLWQLDDSHTLPSALSLSALSSGTVIKDVELAENGAKVDLAVFETHYAPDRKLWFCDIPFTLTGQYTPFVRLAIVRYQEDSLKPAEDGVETRISSIVMADFCQVAPNRFAAVQQNGRDIMLTVSGDAFSTRAGGTLQDPANAGKDSARPTKVPFDNAIRVELQHRWHKLPLHFDPGWRSTNFSLESSQPSVDNGVATWTFKFRLPETPVLFKYRLLVQESETLYGDSDDARANNTQNWTDELFQKKSVKPVELTTYFDYFEL